MTLNEDLTLTSNERQLKRDATYDEETLMKITLRFRESRHLNEEFGHVTGNHLPKKHHKRPKIRRRIVIKSQIALKVSPNFVLNWYGFRWIKFQFRFLSFEFHLHWSFKVVYWLIWTIKMSSLITNLHVKKTRISTLKKAIQSSKWILWKKLKIWPLFFKHQGPPVQVHFHSFYCFANLFNSYNEAKFPKVTRFLLLQKAMQKIH